MTDDEQVRSLLTLAAELPDDIQPPVAALVARGRRRRRRRAAASVLTVVVVTAAAFTLPPVIRSLAPVAPNPAHPGRQQPGPTAAQLTRFHWSALPPSPLGPRISPLLAWTGRYLIELSRKTGSSTNDGAAFDPVARRWHAIASVRANVGFSNAVDVWSGHQLFIANGQTDNCLVVPGANSHPDSCLPNAGLYDPATNRWTTMPLPGQLWGSDLTAAAWTGREVIVAGVDTRHDRLVVAAYEPANRRWRIVTPVLPTGHPVQSVALATTGGRVIMWSDWRRYISKPKRTMVSGVDVLTLDERDQWSTLTGSWPQRLTVDGPIAAGRQILIPPDTFWCGRCRSYDGQSAPHLADGRSLSLTALPVGPPHRDGAWAPMWLWNGATALAANAIDNTDAPCCVSFASIGELAAFDPASRSWHTLPVPQGHPVIAADPIWAGQDLLLLTLTGKLLYFHR